MAETGMAKRSIDRRGILGWLGGSAATLALAACGSPADARAYPVKYSDAEWRKRLTADQYYILRKKGTERPFTSPLLGEHNEEVLRQVLKFDDATVQHRAFGRDGTASRSRTHQPRSRHDPRRSRSIRVDGL